MNKFLILSHGLKDSLVKSSIKEKERKTITKSKG